MLWNRRTCVRACVRACVRVSQWCAVDCPFSMVEYTALQTLSQDII